MNGRKGKDRVNKEGKGNNINSVRLVATDHTLQTIVIFLALFVVTVLQLSSLYVYACVYVIHFVWNIVKLERLRKGWQGRWRERNGWDMSSRHVGDMLSSSIILSCEGERQFVLNVELNVNIKPFTSSFTASGTLQSFFTVILFYFFFFTIKLYLRKN